MAKARNSMVTNQVKLTPVQSPEATQEDSVNDTSQGSQRIDLNNLMQWFQTATNQDVDNLLDDIRAETIDADGRQQDDDITRFFNSIGWAEHTPEVLSEAQYQQALQQEGNPQQLYHADHPYGGVGARQFAQQFMGQGYDFSGNAYRHYLSNGIYGNGTYFADSASDSAGYGTSQYRGFLNSRANPVSYNTLLSQLSTYRQQNPAFDRFFGKLTGGYSGTSKHDDDAAISVFAAMNGYNVIYNGYRYYSVLDRSVMTVSSLTKKTSSGMADW